MHDKTVNKFKFLYYISTYNEKFSISNVDIADYCVKIVLLDYK